MRHFIFAIAFILYSSAIFSQVNRIDSFFSNQLKRFYVDTGTILPIAEFHDVTGKEKKISDFKGKILYLDIWATWCPNCIVKFPYQKQLLKRLQVLNLDTSILFININIDDSKSIWKNALAKFKPVGINLFCTDTLLNEKWNINALPAYLIIDKYGKVAGKNITQPDEPGTIDYLLFSLANNVSLLQAYSKKNEQDNLMAEKKSPTAFTDSAYAKWFGIMSPYLVSDFL